MLLSYHHLLSMAIMVGAHVKTPTLSLDFRSRLFHFLVQEERFSEALSVASVHPLEASPDEKTALIKILLDQKSIPDIVRAGTHFEYAELLCEAGHVKQSDAQLAYAEELYRNTGHAYGELKIEIQRC